MMDHHVLGRMHDQVVLNGRNSKIANQLRPGIDALRFRREHFHDDDRVRHGDRVILDRSAAIHHRIGFEIAVLA